MGGCCFYPPCSSLQPQSSCFMIPTLRPQLQPVSLHPRRASRLLTRLSGYTPRRFTLPICEQRVWEHASQSQLSSQFLLLGSSAIFKHTTEASKLGYIALMVSYVFWLVLFAFNSQIQWVFLFQKPLNASRE